MLYTVEVLHLCTQPARYTRTSTLNGCLEVALDSSVVYCCQPARLLVVLGSFYHQLHVWRTGDRNADDGGTRRLLGSSVLGLGYREAAYNQPLTIVVTPNSTKELLEPRLLSQDLKEGLQEYFFE